MKNNEKSAKIIKVNSSKPFSTGPKQHIERVLNTSELFKEVKMITIKDFAKERGCSESIIYRHIRNNRDALGDNVVKENNKTWLTDEGAEYIRSLMVQPPPPVLLDEDPRLDRLRAELADAKEELKEKDRLLREKDAQMERKDQVLYQLIEKNQTLQIEANKVLQLEAAAQRTMDAEERAKRAEEDRIEMEKVLESMRKEAKMRLDESEQAEEAKQEAEKEKKEIENQAKKISEEAEALKKELEELHNAGLFTRIFGWKKKTKNKE